ncbi:Pilin (type 1 fimbria component protein) [Rhodanobacter glycinis]|uniref:Pilin (Type 1 fimbria component protein) n=2 Tax=Rhodanobacter glycinis TaxID=582702 RepID=A0A1I3Z0W6_9GAMM|nr:Pilin (type 1 fimbria component protein) [Rhodanobacter glycinis]
MLLLLALLLALSGRAHADCTSTNNPGSVTFTPPGGKIMLSNTGAAIGTVVWTSGQATPANYPTLVCAGTTNNGIVSSYGPPVGSDETLYPTNLSWLSFRILHPDANTLLSAYPYNASVPPNTAGTAFSVASALQLVITGTIPSGLQGTSPQLTIPAGKLAQWNVDMTNGSNPVEIFYVTNIQFVIPTCTTAFDPTTVTLSAVRATALSGRGSTAGQQSFQVQLNCVAGARLRITLNATNGKNKGVIYNNNVGGANNNPGAGYARYVGVQILQRDGSTPVTFGNPITIGATQTGTMNLPFYAQYYQTSNSNVTIGDVSATATYTLSYY